MLHEWPDDESTPRRSSGITSRPLEEEQREQEEVPPPGTAKGGTDPALLPRPGEKPAPRNPAPQRGDSRDPNPE